MNRSIGSIYIREALQKADTCFLCYLENRFEYRYIENYLSELVMDSNERKKIAKSRGFCNYHFHKVFSTSRNPATEDGLGIALILKTVTEKLLTDIKAHRNLKTSAPKRSKLSLKNEASSITIPNLMTTTANQTDCPACAYISTIMQTYIQDFLHSLTADEGLLRLYDESAGLCLTHYTAVLFIASRMHDVETAQPLRRVVEKQVQALEKTIKDLSDYIEKQDYRFSEKERVKTEKFLSEGLTRIVGRSGAERTLERILRQNRSCPT
jgi:hypothetical protein